MGLSSKHLDLMDSGWLKLANSKWLMTVMGSIFVEVRKILIMRDRISSHDMRANHMYEGLEYCMVKGLIIKDISLVVESKHCETFISYLVLIKM